MSEAPVEKTPTVQEAYAAYDLGEREAWALYQQDPTVINGRAYLAAERLFRRRRDRAVIAARTARTFTPTGE